MFYVIAAIMVALALAFIFVPIMRNKVGHAAGDLAGVSTEASNLDAFRLQRREIEAEFLRGLMTEAARDEALDELARRMVGEVHLDAKIQTEQPVSGKNATKPAWVLGFVISAFIVAGTALGYAQWGGKFGHDAAGMAAPTSAGAVDQGGQADPNAAMSDKQVLALVENLAKKMEENPNDPRGWILLARSQNALGQYAAAAKAFARAAALTPNDAQLLADYADTKVMAQEGKFDGKPRALIAQALKADPANMKALALAGTAEMRAGNKPAALKHWEKLQSLVPKDSDDFKQVTAIIAEIKTGQPAFAPPAAAAAATTADAGQPAVGAVSGKVVSGQIHLAPELKASLAKGDILFVFARASEGPKMPLAILRVPAPATWPFVFSLNDAMAMTPAMSLSSFPAVIIEARLSKAGDVKLQPGDLLGTSEAIKPSAANVNVTINKVVP